MDFALHILRPQHYDSQNNRSSSAPTYIVDEPKLSRLTHLWIKEHRPQMFHRITIEDLNAFETAILEEIPFEDRWGEDHAIRLLNYCHEILKDEMACFLEAW